MSIVLNNISKSYNDFRALEDISFNIKAGEVVGLLGPNGAGKSTLMKILSCLILPSHGHASICGLDVESQSVEVRKKIGFLPENNPLYTNMYIREYLTYSAGFYNLGKNSKSRIDEMIEITGLSDHLNKKIGILSKGLKQRIGLSQVLLHDPPVLILDEPTSGLDPNQIVEIRKLILSISSNKTILFSSHIMQEVEALCRRIIILDNGKIIADRKMADLINSGAQNSTVIVEFDKPVHQKELETLNGAQSVRWLRENVWLLESDENDDIRKQIMSFALKRKLTILSLNRQSDTLEKVFQKLTKRS